MVMHARGELLFGASKLSSSETKHRCQRRVGKGGQRIYGISEATAGFDACVIGMICKAAGVIVNRRRRHDRECMWRERG